MQNDQSEIDDNFKIDDNDGDLLENKHEESIDVMFYAPVVNSFELIIFLKF